MLAYCLTCGGTGRKGNLSGKKKCPVCNGSKYREVENTRDGKPALYTVCDGPFTSITIPAMKKPFAKIDVSEWFDDE